MTHIDFSQSYQGHRYTSVSVVIVDKGYDNEDNHILERKFTCTDYTQLSMNLYRYGHTVTKRSR